MRSEHETTPAELSWTRYLAAVAEDLPAVRQRAAGAAAERRRLTRAAEGVTADCSPSLPEDARAAAAARWRELLLELPDAVDTRRLRWWAHTRLADADGIYPLTRRDLYSIALAVIAVIASIVLAAVTGTPRGVAGWLVIAAVWAVRVAYLTVPATRRRRAERNERRLDKSLMRTAARADRAAGR